MTNRLIEPKKTTPSNGGEAKATEHVTIPAPNLKIAAFTIRGNAPLVTSKFNSRIQQGIKATQEAGSTARKGGKRAPKDFDALYEGSKHCGPDGWCGIPASAFRAAFISACRVCGFHMTKAKLALFVVADGYDPDGGTALVKITKGKPAQFVTYVRNETGVVDMRARARWAEGWEAVVRVRYDADMFTLSDVANLLARVGLQVGVGEGRPDSKNSCGQSWGTFDVVQN